MYLMRTRVIILTALFCAAFCWWLLQGSGAGTLPTRERNGVGVMHAESIRETVTGAPIDATEHRVRAGVASGESFVEERHIGRVLVRHIRSRESLAGVPVRFNSLT